MLGGWLKESAGRVAEHGAAPVASHSYSLFPEEKEPPASSQGEGRSEELATREKSTSGRKDRTTRREGQAVRYSMTSPKVEAYLQTKLAHPEKIVLVKTGVFYLTFFEDATFCHTELRLQVRNLAAASEPVAIPSCGFPVTAVAKYMARLAAVGKAVYCLDS